MKTGSACVPPGSRQNLRYPSGSSRRAVKETSPNRCFSAWESRQRPLSGTRSRTARLSSELTFTRRIQNECAQHNLASLSLSRFQCRIVFIQTTYTLFQAKGMLKKIHFEHWKLNSLERLNGVDVLKIYSLIIGNSEKLRKI